MYPTRKNSKRRNTKTLRGGAGYYGNTRAPRQGELLGRFHTESRVLHGNDIARILNRESFPQIEAHLKSLYASIESLQARVEELEAPTPVATPAATPIGEDPGQ